MAFGTLEEFVKDYLAPLLGDRDTTHAAAWCPAWFRHPEALVRLNAVWRAFEYLKPDAALGLSNWWLHHADPHLSALMDPVTGPFVRCRSGHMAGLRSLPCDEAPPGLWDSAAVSVVHGDPFDVGPAGDRP
ncbi:DUF4913 domain-containing protein [Streptomyces sp. NPDC000880]